jgi:ribosomal-protein-alanine N-acetyltransferase
MSGMRLFDSVRENAIPLADLHKLCFADPWDAQALARMACGPGFALIRGTLARLEGFVLARVAGGEAEILTLATHPQKRRSGIGRSLMLAAAQEAEIRGAAELFLEVDTRNSAAIALYSALGFRKTGGRKGYYRIPGQPPADALVLAAYLPLGSPSD